MKNAVVLLSGGLDSSTTLAIAKNEGFNIFALTVSYGQRNYQEVSAAKKVANQFGAIEHKIIDLNLRLFGGSSLTDDIAVNSHDEAKSDEIPNTYVPARNTILLSLALSYAEVTKSHTIFFGANIHDYSGYPDCRPSFIKAFENLSNLATKHALEEKITIRAPLVNLKKSEIIAKGVSLFVDYQKTHSCYNPKNDAACGECSACYYRKKGFKDANITDPTLYAS